MHTIRARLHRFLRSTERYTKTDMVYLASGGFWLGAGQVVSTLSVLILAVAMANLLSQETYGTYKFVLSLSGIIGAFSLIGMSAAIVQAVSRGHEGALRAGFATSLRWSVGMALLALGVALYYFWNGNTTIAISMLFAGSFSPFLSSFSLFSSFLEGKKDFRTETLYVVARNLIASVALVIAVFLTNDPVVLVLIYFAAHTLTAALAYAATVRKYRPDTTVDPGTIRYAKHLSLMGILPKVAGNLDKVLLFHFLGPAALAIYSFALAPVLQAENMRGILARLTLPKLSGRGLEELGRAVPRKAFLLFLVMSGIVALYILAAPTLYRILFPQYLESVLYSQALSLMLLLAPTLLFSEALTAHMMKKELYIVRTAIPSINILFLLVLLPFFGIGGAIGALLISQTTGFFLYVHFFYRAVRKRS